MDLRSLISQIPMEPGYVPAPPEPDLTTIQRLLSIPQVARALGQNLAVGAASLPYGVYKGFGDPAAGEAAMSQFQQEYGYTPTNPAAQRQLQGLGEFLQQLETEYKIPPIMAPVAATPALGIRGLTPQTERLARDLVREIQTEPPRGTIFAESPFSPSQRGTITDEIPTFTTREEGNILTVEPTGTPGQTQQAFGGGATTGIYPGTATSTRGIGRSVYGVSEQEANRQIQSLLKAPDTNRAFQIASSVAEQNLGRPYDLSLTMPPSSLAKQSGIGRAYEIASEMPDRYPKDTVFQAYLDDPEYGPIIRQRGIKNYDDLVEQSYKQLEAETADQFRVLPIRMSFHSGDLNYLDSNEMLRDIIGHNHLTVFRGGDPHEFLNKVDPQTGLNSNEQFRAVHDYFGHAIRGNSFGAKGEEVAWASHQQMYSPLARIAMTSETRGQNSFVNYTPINAELFKQMEDTRILQNNAISRGDLEYAQQLAQDLRDMGGQWGYAKQASVVLPPEFTRVEFAGGMPDYLTQAAPARFPSAVETLTHFSRSPDVMALDPLRYGTGIKGAERARLEQTQQPIVPRAFMYRGEAPRPEAGLGPYQYQTQTGGFYDVTQDPERLGFLSFVRNRVPSFRGPYAGIYGPEEQAQALTDLERMAYQYGYRGLLDPDKAVSFQPVPVTRVR
jgi:hypothetical protein